jgi:glycosyltransferase involved in cell wall biosynthesis
MAKIAIIDLCFNWPPLGGSWVDIKNIAQGLGRRGHETMLFVPLLYYGFRRGRIEAPLTFPVKQIPFSRFSYNFISAPRKFRKAVNSFDPDFVFIADGYFLKPFLIHAFKDYKPIVRFYAYEIFCIQNNRFTNGKSCTTNLLDAHNHVCRTCRSSLFPLLQGIAKLIKNEPQYFVFHEYLMSLAFLPLYRSIFRRALAEAGKLVVYNNIQRELLQKYNPNIFLIPSGVDTKLFSPHPSESNRPFTIGLAGRYYEEAKGLEVALQACRLLHSEGWDFQVLIASPNEITIQDEFASHCGWYDRNQLPAFYNRCDVTIVPSLWEEPFGMAAVESLACGTPVIASNSGALPTVVEDGKSGLIFRSGDEKALADRIRYLLKNPKVVAKMKTAARERAVKAFSWDGIIKQFYLPFFESH